MKLTKAYINNRTNPRTCIWFTFNTEYFGFPFRSVELPNQLVVTKSAFSKQSWNRWLEDKTILKLTKQIGKELCN